MHPASTQALSNRCVAHLYVQKGIQQKQPANVPNPEVSDTTGDAKCTVAGNKKITGKIFHIQKP